MVEHRGTETLEAIDRAAVELFAERGYHATPMREIASKADVQAAAIYHWYPSKEALLVRLQDDFMERLTARVLAAMDRQQQPAMKLAAAVFEHVVFHGLNRREAFVTDSEIRALSGKPREALIAKRDGYQRIFGDLIEAGIAEGTLRCSEPAVAINAILLECTGAALWFDPDGELSLSRVAAVHVELVLGSLGASRDQTEASIEVVSEAAGAGDDR